MDPNSELFRAKQQVIYYRAEIAQYKNKISELERLIEKEVVRNKYLQAKIRELNGEKIAGLQEEILRLRKKVMELEVELEEETTYLPSKNSQEDEIGLYSYFNYSIILPAEGESTISVYGTFNIINTANLLLDDLVVCLKITPVGAFTFSAKVSDPKLLNGPGREREDIEWVYAVEDWLERVNTNGEYWLKNIHEKIKTTDKLLFPFEANFDLNRIKKAEIDALIYHKTNLDHKKLNKIILLK